MPQRLCAFSSIASNTGLRSPGEELMTPRTSAVAVCCSNASRVSLISRAFSIATTACVAKFCSRRDLLVGKRANLATISGDVAQQGVVLAQWNGVDDAQHLGGRGLLLACLCQVRFQGLDGCFHLSRGKRSVFFCLPRNSTPYAPPHTLYLPSRRHSMR